MEVVGEAILSAGLELLFDKLRSSELMKFARQENVLAELRNWKNQLLIIDEVLDDAENKQITRKSVKNWLADLRDLAYDMEDVLDEFHTELLRRKLMAERPQVASASKVRSLIPTCFSSLNPVDDFKFNVEIGSKINEITSRLKDISAWKDKLGLTMVLGVERSSERIAYGGTASWQRLPTTSLINEPVHGRDDDKNAIIELLLKDDLAESNFSVIPIIGMGGIGKTTLTRSVYNDEKVKHFHPKIWICVSDEFDVVKITKLILKAVSPLASGSDDLDQLQGQLTQALVGKRFLLVLDDVWNKNLDHWKLLQAPFVAGDKGSRIIVTTRDAEIASMMATVNYHFKLKHLSNEECWNVFLLHVKDQNSDTHQNLETRRKKVENWCCGLPLAAKVLGCLLRFKHYDHEWEDILNSKVWSLPIEKCEILPVLRLSYYHLPSHLKRCFAYCAIFPKDYEFEEKELILLWMAEGLIRQTEGDEHQMEHLGANYFHELLSRSFFQPSSNNASRFVMHDLVNDLAQAVMGEVCFNLDDDKRVNNNQHIISEQMRYLSFNRGEYDVFKKFEVFNKVEHLRSFIALPIHVNHGGCYLSPRVFHDLLPKLRHLRVLSLSGYEISELPDWMGNLKSLRYLNLSHAALKWLPESISCLHNLQALILRNCKYLIKLPMNLGNLINLRHLNISGSLKLKQMPPRVGDLINLKTLSKFVVGKEKRSGIKELKNLLSLGGELYISRLHNVVNIREAKEANLKDKHNIEELTLEWGGDLDDLRNESNELEVFKLLQPHGSLRKLVIGCYNGQMFPSWIGDPSFSRMVHLSLKNCKNCARLPPLGRLLFLKELHIEGVNEIKSVGDEFYGEIANPFPSLESLKFEDMPEWKDWFSPKMDEEIPGPFPYLRELTMTKCPKLINLPSQLPSLVKLHIHECQDLVNESNEQLLKSWVVDVPSLTELSIRGISRLSCLWERFSQPLTALETLQIKDCDELGSGLENLEGLLHLSLHECGGFASLEEQGLPCNLQSLTVNGFPILEKLPDALGSLTSLTNMRIENCPKLVSLAEASFPPMLKEIVVKKCEALKSLPDGMMMINSCVLESLEIEGCPSLNGFPKGELPTTLKILKIGSCKMLECLPEGMMHQEPIDSNNTCGLESLSVCGCPSLKSIPGGQFPSTLKRLSIFDCEQLESIPETRLQNFTSLRFLCLINCPDVVSLSESLAANLKSLIISDCENMKRPLSEWVLHTLTSLNVLAIEGPFPDVVSFSDEASQLLLPTSLASLWLVNFQNLKSIASMGLQSLVSLNSLLIVSCPKLRSLVPKEGLPPTLALLRIKECPILKKRCLKEKGKYWPKIAHIPYIDIDGIIQQ